MTIEELKQYDDLGDQNQLLYHNIKSQHPDWNHRQIMTFLSVSLETSSIDSDELIDQILSQTTLGCIDTGGFIIEKIKDMFK